MTFTTSVREHVGSLARVPAGFVAAGRARVVGHPGTDFDTFGRRLGLRLVARGNPWGLSLIAAPVSIVRYWEFPFVWRWLPRSFTTAIDLASPRLLSLRCASEFPNRRITMVNPDGRDANVTRELTHSLGLTNLDVLTSSVFDMSAAPATVDCAWSISVIEHINESGRSLPDADAVRELVARVRSGGRVILTVPTQPRFFEEYRNDDVYGLNSPTGGGYFFQRWYDEESIHDRLIEPIGIKPTAIEWFGEREAGTFQRYHEEWVREGWSRTVSDPLEVARGYREYASFRELPGMGVCGICLTVP